MEFRSPEVGGGEEAGVSSSPGNGAAAAATSATAEVRYHECLRNHAAAQGGHVVDGCGEFMPASGADPFRCAACGCHRSFHRRVPSPDDHPHHLLLLPHGHRAAPPPLLLPPPPHPYLGRGHHTPCGSGGTTTESSSEDRGPAAAGARKRFRTKFTPEQKEQMQAFAERVGWKVQRQDEALVERFCAQVGVRRQVLKVWMHNNKHSGGGGRRHQHQQPQLQQQSQQQQQHPP